MNAEFQPITSFTGEFDFLSSFYPATLRWGDWEYPTPEHAFQAAKTFDLNEARRICNAPTPGVAKRLGRQVQLREDWETVKIPIMYLIHLDKYKRHPDLRARLIASGTRELIEGNTWGDRYWGVCDGKGRNMLGWVLMTIRAALR